MQFYFSSGYDAGSWDRAKKAQLENKGKNVRGWLAISTFFCGLMAKKRERKSERSGGERAGKKEKIPKSHCGRYRLAPNGPDKEKQRNNIITRSRGGLEGRKQNRKKSKKSFSLVFVLFE